MRFRCVFVSPEGRTSLRAHILRYPICSDGSHDGSRLMIYPESPRTRWLHVDSRHSCWPDSDPLRESFSDHRIQLQRYQKPPDVFQSHFPPQILQRRGQIVRHRGHVLQNFLLIQFAEAAASQPCGELPAIKPCKKNVMARQNLDQFRKIEWALEPVLPENRRMQFEFDAKRVDGGLVVCANKLTALSGALVTDTFLFRIPTRRTFSK
jgi:hypothetical protein